MSDAGVDAIAEWGRHTFALIWKASGSPRHVHAAIRENAILTDHCRPDLIPLLVVPYMSPAGRRRCTAAALDWLDLSGNAHIKAPELVVRVEGHKNRFARPGRPDTAFAPRGSRVARWLLIEPRRFKPQGELAQLTRLNRGYVSRVLAKLHEMGLVERSKAGVRTTDPDRLLDAWRDEYRFDRHRRLAGHVTSTRQQSVSELVANACAEHGLRYSLTGLSAAWSRTQFTRYRLTTVYVARTLPNMLEQIGFDPEPRGANLWLVVPYDEGVFDGASVVNSLNCVHPVQNYLDLDAHPERSREAAEGLRAQFIWHVHDE